MTKITPAEKPKIRFAASNNKRGKERAEDAERNIFKRHSILPLLDESLMSPRSKDNSKIMSMTSRGRFFSPPPMLRTNQNQISLRTDMSNLLSPLRRTN